MAQTISAQDREILRQLATEQLEWAHSDTNQENLRQWRRNNAFQPGRPLVQLELGTFEQEIIPQRLRCQGEAARGLEASLYRNFINLKLFDDDYPVPDFFPVGWRTHFTLFGLQIGVEAATDANGMQVGHAFQHIVHDLQEDYAKLGATTFGVDRQATQQYRQMVDDAIGDILPTKMVMGGLYSVPTQQVVHIMGMENMLFGMMDYPELFLEMMDRIANDTLAYFRFLEQEELLLPTTGLQGLGNGSWCFTDDLPQQPKTTHDVWGFMDSQESVGVSPDMFEEMIFPCYKKIASEYGLLSYGCCEAVDPVWENCLATLPNLRKLSISPWCNEEYMGQQLRGRKTVYFRKPSPNYLGVGTVLDEEAVRGHIRTTLKAAQGCTLEFAQRDVYTINNDEAKARRYIEIIKQEIAEHWQP